MLRVAARLVLLLGLACGHGCLQAPALDVPDLGPVGDFSLTERSGKTITAADLRGQVWIASFVFTRCTGPCPQVTGTMARLQSELAREPDLRLVTFTVDPGRDDPKELTKYADHFGADAQRWLFLTGKEDAIDRLLIKGFKVPVDRSGKELGHSPRLVLVDRQGHIRGYFDGIRETLSDDPERDFEANLKRLRESVALLLREQPMNPLAVFDFPALNAGLNSVSGVLLVLGWIAIRSRAVRLHMTCMLSALVVSAVFLSSYLYYHIVIKAGRETRFAEQWPEAPVSLSYLYYTILISHVFLAVVVTPMALYTAYLGLKNRLVRHVWLARWTLPIWLYVSITGVVVYWMLYRLYPAG